MTDPRLLSGDVPPPTGPWAVSDLPDCVDATVLAEAASRLFDDAEAAALGRTDALLVVHGATIVFERYGAGTTETTTLPSWSMAKSMCHAVIGTLVSQGLLELDAPAPVPEWESADDPRSAITLRHLLHMSSGLSWVEDYVDGSISDVIEMLFGGGVDDMAAFAAAKPLVAEPGTVANYSSGTTNIVSRLMGDTIRTHHGEVGPYLDTALFGAIGMASATPKFDGAGNWIASSFCFATARDFARFGLLHLRDGRWGDRRVLPDGWVDLARRPAPVQPGDSDYGYGSHWWLGTIPATGASFFGAHGYEGQRIWVVPDHDIVLVRSGQTAAELMPAVDELLVSVVGAFSSPA